MIGGEGGIDAAKKRRLKIHETTLENDIRYRGPLSPTHFKVLGWLCIVVAQIAVLIRFGGAPRRGLRGRGGRVAGCFAWRNHRGIQPALNMKLI